MRKLLLQLFPRLSKLGLEGLASQLSGFVSNARSTSVLARETDSSLVLGALIVGWHTLQVGTAAELKQACQLHIGRSTGAGFAIQATPFVNRTTPHQSSFQTAVFLCKRARNHHAALLAAMVI